MNNSRVEYTQLEQGILEQSNIACEGKHVLCIQDTTEINYGSNNKNIKPNELGPSGNNINLGFFTHPVLLLNADDDDYFPLGYSSINLWTRPAGLSKKHPRKNKPFEERESYKWIKGIESTNKITRAKIKTIIGDRESDNYQNYVWPSSNKSHIIARCRCDRALVNSEYKMMFEFLNNQPIDGSIEVQVKANPKTARRKHIAKLEIKFREVQISRPANLPKSLPETVRLYLVEAKESKETVGKNEPAVEWRLLTTHKVEDLKKAEKIIEWYTVRWQVEELFATIKSRAFNIEKSQLETKDGLFKLTILTFVAALKVLQLVKGRQKENYKAKIIFTKKEIGLLNLLLKKYEGATRAQQNNYKKESLAWASWVIGRMGGWKGYQSDSPPGIKTMKRGLDKFQSMLELLNLIE